MKDTATTTPSERYPVGPANVPHRNNAAEWVIVAALLPVATLLRGMDWVARCTRSRGRRCGDG